MTLKPVALKLMGKKRGMMQFFDDKGNVIVCTVIEVEPNVVTQVKTKECDGYNAIQLGFEKLKAKDPRTLVRRAGKPLTGHFAKAGVEPRRHLAETRLDKTDAYTLGQEITIAEFANFKYLDATAISKGKGYQGVMKLHGFAGGPASHGSSGFHRKAGSTGQRSTPGRCMPGQPRASHMGVDRITVQNVKVVAVRPEDNVILVEGQVPGARNGLVYLSPAIKKEINKKK